MIKYMAVAVAVAVSGGVAVAVPVAGLTKKFTSKKISQSMSGVTYNFGSAVYAIWHFVFEEVGITHI